LAVVDSLDMWDSTPLIFTGFIIFLITVFMVCSFYGYEVLPRGGMLFFWWLDFIPTLLIDTATLLRYLHRMN